MVSPVLYENYYSGAFLIREANGYLSRDTGVINNATGTDVSLQGGLVLSRDVPASAAAVALGTNVGNGTFGAITLAAPAQAGGTYVLNMESATGFVVVGPSGVEIGHGVAGTVFNAGGLSFTLTAGGTAFAAGDSFDINVSPWDGAYTPYTGALPAVAILFSRTYVPANGSKKVTLVTRLAEVNQGEVQWDPSVTGSGSVATLEAAAIASLTALGIVFRQVAPSAG